MIEIICIAFIFSLISTVLSKIFLKIEKTKELISLSKNISEMFKTIDFDNNEKYLELMIKYNKFLKSFIILYIKTIMFTLLPFILGILTLEYFSISTTIYLYPGLSFIGKTISPIGFYVLSYIAFSTLLNALINPKNNFGMW